MSGLTIEQHNKLLESIRQWGQSQDRIQGEQDHRAALAATLKDECGIAEKHFKRDEIENLVTACPHCNISKKDRTPEEWKR